MNTLMQGTKFCMQKGFLAELSTIVSTGTHTHSLTQSGKHVLTHTQMHPTLRSRCRDTQTHTHALNTHTHLVTHTPRHMLTCSNRFACSAVGTAPGPAPGHPDTHGAQKPTHSAPHVQSHKRAHTDSRSLALEPCFHLLIHS